jgi:hypothetical protein
MIRLKHAVCHFEFFINKKNNMTLFEVKSMALSLVFPGFVWMCPGLAFLSQGIAPTDEPGKGQLTRRGGACLCQ